MLFRSFGETFVIDQGSQAGIQRDMTVISAGGLVGVVKSTTSNSAVVLLMSDPSFRMGVRLAGSQDMGILSGEGEGRYSLEMLSATGKIAMGDVLLTRGSSGDRPFVTGIPVGKVKVVENSIGQLTKRAQVDAFVMQQFFPGGIPTAQKDRIENSLDEILFAGEITVQQRLRHPDAPCQFTGLNTEPSFGKIGNGCIENLLPAGGWIQAHPGF